MRFLPGSRAGPPARRGHRVRCGHRGTRPITAMCTWGFSAAGEDDLRAVGARHDAGQHRRLHRRPRWQQVDQLAAVPAVAGRRFTVMQTRAPSARGRPAIRVAIAAIVHATVARGAGCGCVPRSSTTTARSHRYAARSRRIAGADPACNTPMGLATHAPFLPLFAPGNSSAIGLNLRGWPGPTEESTVSRRSRAAQAFHRQGCIEKRAGGITAAPFDLRR